MISPVVRRQGDGVPVKVKAPLPKNACVVSETSVLEILL